MDGRVNDQEIRGLYKELEERDKMMELIAADFDDEIGNTRSRFSAVSMKLDQPFESVAEMYVSTQGGEQQFQERFAMDVARIVKTDEDRVVIVGTD